MRWREPVRGDGVRHLVPEHRFPIRAAQAGAGAAGGNQRAEADAEKALAAGEREGAHREILLGRQHVHRDIEGQRDVVFPGQRLPGFRAEREGSVAEKDAIRGGHAQADAAVVQGLHFRHRLAQSHEIEGGDMVGISIQHPLNMRPAFGFTSEAEKIRAQLEVGRHVIRIHGQGGAERVDGFLEAVVAGEARADREIHVGVFMPRLERLLAGGSRSGHVAAQLRHQGTERPGIRLGGIDLFDLGERFRGLHRSRPSR